MAIRIGDRYTEIIIKFQTAKVFNAIIREQISKLVDIIEYKTYDTRLTEYVKNNE